MLPTYPPSLLIVILLGNIIWPSLTFLGFSLTGLHTFYSSQTEPFIVFYFSISSSIPLCCQVLVAENALLAILYSVSPFEEKNLPFL